jgi:hypothetical protein
VTDASRGMDRGCLPHKVEHCGDLSAGACGPSRHRPDGGLSRRRRDHEIDLEIDHGAEDERGCGYAAQKKLKKVRCEVCVCGRHPRRRRECRVLDIVGKLCRRAKDHEKTQRLRRAARRESFWSDT